MFMSDVTLSITDDSKDLPAQRLKEPSALDQLKSVVSQEVSLPVISVDLPARPNVQVRFSPNIKSAELKFWRQRSTDKRGELDNVKFSSYVATATCDAILINGNVVLLEDGVTPLVFNSEEFAEMMNVPKSQVVPDGIQEFFGVDAHLETTALTILSHAGYGEEIELDDPI